MPEKSSSPEGLTVKCPSCDIEVEWVASNSFRPFCSGSCQNKDFVDWANEEHKVSGSADYDDIFSMDTDGQATGKD